jgi:hypothetical protein
VLTPSGVCSVAGNVITMTSGTGTCTLTANWAAYANYLAAGPLTQTTNASQTPSTTAIVSNLPNPVPVGQSLRIRFSATGIKCSNGDSDGQPFSDGFSPSDAECILASALELNSEARR